MKFPRGPSITQVNLDRIMPIADLDYAEVEKRMLSEFAKQKVYNRTTERKADKMRDQDQAAVVMLVLAGFLIIGWAWNFFIKGRRGR